MKPWLYFSALHAVLCPGGRLPSGHIHAIFSVMRRLMALLLALPALAAPPVSAAIDRGPVATIAMIAEPLGIESLMGPGVDPHLYKLTRTDIARLIEAPHLLYCGLGLEGKMLDAFERLAASGKPATAVCEAVPEAKRLQAAAGYAGAADPHLWMDPTLWAGALQVAADRLGMPAPDGFERLDAYARASMESIPAQARVLVTAHDAFAYFGRRYGLKVVGIQGVNTESEAGLRAIEAAVETVVARRLPAVFVESTVSDRNVRAIVEGAAARGHRVAIGGRLFSDAMGPEGTYEGTYIGMIDHNVTTIARALGGIAPARGMQGRLRARDR